MSTPTPFRSLTMLAPAKVNLFLHVAGRREDGYHLLDSLVAFADIGDALRIDPAPEFSFSVQGIFAPAFHAKERESGPDSANLAVRAVHALAKASGNMPAFHLSLTKNIPLGAGLGGGSSDAGAVLWALVRAWNISPQAPYLPDIALSLGADVPVCVGCRPVRLRGVGEVLDPVPEIPEIPAVLVWPGRPCATAEVFRGFSGSFRDEVVLPESFGGVEALIAFLQGCGNDLTPDAARIVPEVSEALESLGAEPGCLLARMSGSGSSCFGLFADEAAALSAAESLARARPSWWVRAGWIGRAERY